MQKLRKRRDFLELRDARRANAATLTLQNRVRPADQGEPRIGFTVTKKCGGAVQRNRIKRRLREAVRLAALHLRPGQDYVVIGRRAALGASFAAIQDELRTALGRVHEGRLRPSRGAVAADEANR